MKFIKLFSSFLLLLFCIGCQNQPTVTNQQQGNLATATNNIEENTKKLLRVFLEEENMEKLDVLLDESIKFHWPDKTILNKSELMNACRELTQKHDNKTEIIDIVTEGDKSFVLFVWSGTVKEDTNPKIVGKPFSIHDCYRLTWKDDKIVEWYTIWGSMDYLMQLGYTFTPPSIE